MNVRARMVFSGPGLGGNLHLGIIGVKTKCFSLISGLKPSHAFIQQQLHFDVDQVQNLPILSTMNSLQTTKSRVFRGKNLEGPFF